MSIFCGSLLTYQQRMCAAILKNQQFLAHPSELSESKQQIIDDKEKLLADLNKEISRKRNILIKGIVASAVLAGGALGMYYLSHAFRDAENYLEDQKDPNTWEKPCGNTVAWLSREAGGPPSTQECFSSNLVKGIEELNSNDIWYDFWQTLKHKYPECYSYCMNMPQLKPGFYLFVMIVFPLISLASSIGSVMGLSRLLDIVFLKDLSQDYQRRVKEYLSAHGHEEISEDMTVAELKEILTGLEEEPQNIAVLSV